MLTTGFVTWVLRGGALASALLTSMPAWRGFDPLVIVVARRKKDDKDVKDEDESEVERVFENAARAQALGIS